MANNQGSIPNSWQKLMTVNAPGDYPVPGTISPVTQRINLNVPGAFGGGGGGHSVLGASTTKADPYSSYGGKAAYSSQNGLYDQSIGNTQSALGRLGGQLTAGNSAIDASYQNALKQLLSGKNQAEGTYNTNKTQTAQDWRTAKNGITQDASSSLTGLLRLLGIRGAGGGSAYQFGAPDAVIAGANSQRGNIGQTYGRNAQALDTNWNNYLTDYSNQVADAASQRTQGKQKLQDTFNTNKATLLQTLAKLSAQKASYNNGNAAAASQGYINQANAILDKVGTGKTAPIKYTTKAYTAPALDQYTVNPNAAPTYSNPTGDSYQSPYLANLLGKDKNRLAFGA